MEFYNAEVISSKCQLEDAYKGPLEVGPSISVDKRRRWKHAKVPRCKSLSTLSGLCDLCFVRPRRILGVMSTSMDVRPGCPGSTA